DDFGDEVNAESTLLESKYIVLTGYNTASVLNYKKTRDKKERVDLNDTAVLQCERCKDFNNASGL
ncbi:4269_t:CDS:2, partial [Gigaspora rosea]